MFYCTLMPREYSPGRHRCVLGVIVIVSSCLKYLRWVDIPSWYDGWLHIQSNWGCLTCIASSSDRARDISYIFDQSTQHSTGQLFLHLVKICSFLWGDCVGNYFENTIHISSRKTCFLYGCYFVGWFEWIVVGVARIPIELQCDFQLSRDHLQRVRSNCKYERQAKKYNH